MKHLKKTFLLLMAGVTTISGAWAQTRVLAQAGERYTIESSAAAVSAEGQVKYRWYRNGTPISGAAAEKVAYEVPKEVAFGEAVEFKRAAYVDGCNEKKFSNALTIRFCNVLTPSGVCWADANVDDPGVFAERPDAYTKFYQWNRADKPWPATGAITGAWEASITDPEWTTTPCPEGWRLPTREEYVELDGLGGDLDGNKGGKWVAANEKGNEKPGRYYGPSFATCKLDSAMVGCVFFPASGARNYTNGGIIVQGSVGHGWSTMQSAPASGYALLLNVTTTYAAIGLTKAYGLTIRCVQ